MQLWQCGGRPGSTHVVRPFVQGKLLYEVPEQPENSVSYSTELHDAVTQTTPRTSNCLGEMPSQTHHAHPSRSSLKATEITADLWMTAWPWVRMIH